MFAAESVLDGGIPIVEIADTIPNADQVIRDLQRNFPTLTVGAEVTSGLEEAQRHIDAGAEFLTGPGLDQGVVGHCIELDIMVIPGTLTPTEIMTAHRMGADFIKVFPCSGAGGPKYIRALKAALPHVPLIAAGGVTQTSAPQFIAAGAVALGVGEDLIPRQALRFHEGAWIRELASRFIAFVQQARAQLG
jgi:2-dehydro-3-deoxyphosphogluconate aldolase/(4S)-4-hydroxy-2-oxoglutarate aldolase